MSAELDVISRSRLVVERVLADQGEHPERELVLLQHDLADWEQTLRAKRALGRLSGDPEKAFEDWHLR